LGPLGGIRIVELAGFGPGPMGAMMLGDLGADVIRVDRVHPNIPQRFADPRNDVHGRSRRSIALDLRNPDATECFLRLIETADGLIEPYRPGVAERLGIGPEECLKRNPKLVYLRITGWGQTGPLSQVAGHDLNYIALTGLLSTLGPPNEKPVPPLNLVGDFGGGGMLVAVGMTSALLECAKSGKGQVVDAAMMEGAALLFGGVFAMHTAGLWRERGKNQVDGGAPYYQVYETKDGQYIAIGAIEPQFYKELIEHLGLSASDVPGQYDHETWPQMVERLSAIFRQRTRDEWCELLEGTDTCFAPVLTITEAPVHTHAVARNAYVNVEGVQQPAPAPRFSRTAPIASVAPRRGQHTQEIMLALGYSEPEFLRLQSTQAIFQQPQVFNKRSS
jgi:alpha-methylacyl-CoA racemase